MRGDPRNGSQIPLPVFLLVAVLAIGGGLYAYVRAIEPPPPAPFVTVTFYDTPPQVRTKIDPSWQTLGRDEPIVEGAQIRTSEGLRTTVRLDLQSTLRLGAHTLLSIRTLKRGASSVEVELGLEGGTVWVDRAASATVRVSTEGATVRAEGAQTEITSRNGVVVVRAWVGGATVAPVSGSPVKVPARRQLELLAGTHLKPRAIERSDVGLFEKWNQTAKTDAVVEGRINRERSSPSSATPAAVAQGEPAAVTGAPSSPGRVAGGATLPAAGARPDESRAAPRYVSPGGGYPVAAPGGVYGQSRTAAGASAPARTSAGASAPTRSTGAGASLPSPSASASSSASDGRVRSTWQPSPVMTRGGLPDLRTMGDRELPTLDTTSPAGVERAFDSVANELSGRLGMKLTRPCQVLLVAAGAPQLRQTEAVQVESPSDGHHIYIQEGLDPTEAWGALAYGYGAAWYNENHYVYTQGGNKWMHVRAGFGYWCAFKLFAWKGVASAVAPYLSGDTSSKVGQGGAAPKRVNDWQGVQELLAMEQASGEYGVVYYVTHGTAP